MKSFLLALYIASGMQETDALVVNAGVKSSLTHGVRTYGRGISLLQMLGTFSSRLGPR